ncbi:MAG: TAXI family TRAP transporter solute-binding subunit [Firmicutes bacterium]|nr:TAXI family TRAP transporter solute-binding subunit [Bacillota bacterium]
MNKRIIAVLVVLSLVMFGVLGCGSDEKTSSEGEVKKEKAYVTMATATTAGIYFALGNAITNMWNKEIEGVQVSVQSTAGSGQNVELLARNEAHVAFMQNGVGGDAWAGKNTFEGKPVKDFVGMTYLYPNLCYFVVSAKSDINDLTDLKGKKIIPGPVGSGTELNARQILSIAGIDYQDNKDASADYVSNAEAAQKFTDRQADMAFIAGGIPHAAVTEMMTRTDARILDLQPDVIEKLIERFPAYFPVEVPANSYKGQAEPVQTVAVGNLLVVRKDMDEQLVYDMLDKIYANKDQLANSFKGAANFKIENGINGMTMPMHPGAVKFFTDNGVTVPEHLKL